MNETLIHSNDLKSDSNDSKSNSNESKEVWLTSIDNPFNPFTRFDDWFRFDTFKQYNICNYIARIAIYSESMSESEKDKAIENAVDQILELNPYAKEIFRKVTPSSHFEIS